jgi:hypothetical protein
VVYPFEVKLTDIVPEPFVVVDVARIVGVAVEPPLYTSNRYGVTVQLIVEPVGGLFAVKVDPE